MWPILEKLLSPLLAPAVLALGGWIYAHLSKSQQTLITSALSAVKGVLANIASSAPKTMTVANLQSVLVGAANAEVKSLGLDPTNPLIAAGISTIVSDALALFATRDAVAPDTHLATVALSPTPTLLAVK